MPGLQLSHAGRKASRSRPWGEGSDAPLTEADGGWSPLGPSPLPFADGYRDPAKMTHQQIAAAVGQLTAAAALAVTAGFRAVELHAGHGRLLHSFLSPIANQRTDTYGSTYGGRTLGVPLAVTGWLGHHESDGGERWIIDPTFAEGHGATGHRRLMALLAAPNWGLPLTPLDSHCNCHLPPGYSDQCTTITAGAARQRGVLEVRTIHRSGGRLKWIQQHRPTIYAAQQQLALPVPAWVHGWLDHGGFPAPDVPVDATRAGSPGHVR
ncbi:oxidoreductase [Streptomyces sp. NPDC055506]